MSTGFGGDDYDTVMSAIVRSSMRPLTVGLPFTAAFVVLFWPTFGWMAERFTAYNSFYSHGWLIPLASAWIMWQRRERLQQLTPRASYWGLALVIPSAAVHVVASWWGIGFLSGFAMVSAIWGLVWTLWGRQTLAVLRFPMLFLLFMVPLPGVLLVTVSFYMKLFAATMATTVVTFLGIPAVQTGSTIQLPGVSVIVDDTCSGLRSLISLLALSTVWTTLMPSYSKRWQKLTVIASAIPIALLANMVRMLVLMVVAMVFGVTTAEGFIHYGSGIVVFGVALGTLAWLSHILTKRPNSVGSAA